MKATCKETSGNCCAAHSNAASFMVLERPGCPPLYFYDFKRCSAYFAVSRMSPRQCGSCRWALDALATSTARSGKPGFGTFGTGVLPRASSKVPYEVALYPLMRGPVARCWRDEGVHVSLLVTCSSCQKKLHLQSFNPLTEGGP